jgi:hypothetical protein
MRATPKSARKGWPERSIRMLAGLISRWTMPLWWAKSRASATGLSVSMISRGEKDLPESMSA